MVLDTNVIVAGVSSKQGASYQLLKEIPAQSFILLVSVPLFVEYEATLKRKKTCKLHGLSHQDVDGLLEVWARVCEPVFLNFLRLPRDFTWDELVQLLRYFDYIADQKGKTSGSRIQLTRDNYPPIDLHKPHPDNVVKSYVMRRLRDFLIEEGLLEANDDNDAL